MPDAICFFVSQKMDDVFDLFDEIDAIGNQNPQQQANLSVGNDSALPDSIDGFGIDIDNPEANEEYLGENQNPQAIIHGPGVVDENIQPEEKDSGLATSLSGTHVSEFTPIVTEYNLESEPGTDDNKNDQNDGNSDQLETTSESAFDLAIDCGYIQQAMTYLYHSPDDLHSKHKKQLKELLPNTDSLKYPHKPNDIYVSRTALVSVIKMEIMNFQNYLENIQANQFEEVLQRIEIRKKNGVSKFFVGNGEEMQNRIETLIEKCLKGLKMEANALQKSMKIDIILKIIREHIEKMKQLLIFIETIPKKDDSVVKTP